MQSTESVKIKKPRRVQLQRAKEAFRECSQQGREYAQRRSEAFDAALADLNLLRKAPKELKAMQAARAAASKARYQRMKEAQKKSQASMRSILAMCKDMQRRHDDMFRRHNQELEEVEDDLLDLARNR
tara:strand:- start:43 stop:426 length:384 start_codon:yes stop_codon:yes gene_type:complete